MNLVVNARDAVGARGHIRLEVVERELASTDPLLGDALAPGRCVVLSVIDDGEGMSEATLARVFEPFFTTKAPHRGTGLGLSTVRGIVHRMGGRIRCESAPGAGARFDVVLPAAAPEAEPASASAGASDLDLELSGRTVLIADDEPLIRAAVARALSAEGSRVLTADDGAAALALIEAEAASIDLLITDMVMPGAHGPEVAGRLRARRPEAQVLFLSGQGLAVDEVAPAPAPLLVKPFTLEDLTAAARAALAGRSSPASS
jgi:CheY-like chemotaxis protein